MDRQKKMEDPLPARVRVETSGVQLLSLSNEEVQTSSLHWGDPPKLLNIKEEQEELWSGQEAEQRQGLGQTINKFPPALVPVKGEEDDEEKPQSSRLHHTEEMKTESEVEDCVGPEPVKNFNPDSHLQPNIDEVTSHSSETETDDSCDWEETSELKLGLNTVGNIEQHESYTGKTPIGTSECATGHGHMRHQQERSEIKTGKKTFMCPVCEKTFQIGGDVVNHQRIHRGEKPFGCSLCGTRFTLKRNLRQHMRTHAEEKPFSCSSCSKRFTRKESLIKHTRIHTGEKPYTCSVCDTGFTLKQYLTQHMRIHTGEKPFSCTLCRKRFGHNKHLSQHMRTHTGERPYSCPTCDKGFARFAHLKRHTCVGENSGGK